MGKSHFPIDLGLLTAVEQLIPPKSTILELGSGEGTKRLLPTNTMSIQLKKNSKGWLLRRNNIYSHQSSHKRLPGFNNRLV